MLSKIYVFVVAVLYLVLAAWCTLQPDVTSAKVGFQLIGGSGQSEFMTVYGGLEFAMALILLATLLPNRDVMDGVWVCVIIHVSLVLFRTVAFFRFSGIESFTWNLAIGEWMIALLGVAILYVRNRTADLSDKSDA